MPVPMIAHRGVEFAIVCNGQSLPIYKRTIEDDVTVSGYIASVEGQPFVFHLRNAESDHELCCRLNVDGQVASRPFLSSKSRSWRVCSGMRTSSETERTFRFSNIQFTESSPEDIALMKARCDFSQIGVIEFIVWRGTNTQRKLREFPYSRTLHVSPVPEKSKKAGWHRVALGEEVKIERRRPCVPKLLDTKDKPYAVIRIRYQPAPLLRANGILPTISSSEAVTTTRTKRVHTEDEPDATSSRKRRKPLKPEEIECSPSAVSHQIKAEVDAASVQVEDHGSHTDHEDHEQSEELQTPQNRSRVLKEKTEMKKGKSKVK